jgi:DNA-binding CsgD family transcriptional regulator
VNFMLRGRRSESEVLTGLLDATRSGQSGALVVRGEAGVGKTALLEDAIASGSDHRVVRGIGIESEMELAYAPLHQVCAPMLDRVECLPGPQRDALSTAFGLRDGAAPDRFLIGLAVLGLLSEAARERALLCVVDGAQWLDRASAQALAFAARRLCAESVALVVSTRATEDEFRGLPELVVGGLPDDAARALLDSVIPGPLDALVRERLIAETGGNPLALLELPRGLTPAQLAGGFGVDGAMPLAGRIEESYRRRLQALPTDTQRLVLVAAAEPVGDPALVWRAATDLGIAPAAAAAAESDGLLVLGARVRFRQPLARSAVYHAASAADRRSVHHALAEATDPELDPDRRAWHRAQAADAPDEDVAEELERSAGRAQARGGLAAAAAFLTHAVRLTPDPARRGERALAAAQAALLAGDADAATEMLAIAQAGPLDALGRARVDLLHARIAFASNRSRQAPRLLLRAAKELEPLDARLARETYLEAFTAALFAGHLAQEVGLPDVARAARAAPPALSPEQPGDLLLDGLALLFTEGYAAGAPALHRALRALCGHHTADQDGLRWLSLAGVTAADLWDDHSWQVLSDRHVTLCRDAGALSELPVALTSRAQLELFAGDPPAAAALVQELDAATGFTESRLPPYGAISVAALRGREPDVAERLDAALHDIVSRGEGSAVTHAHWARAVLYNGLGRYEQAASAAQQATAHAPGMSPGHNWGLLELVEAAARSGQTDRAADALERLSATTRAAGTDWALGVEARARALLSEGPAAERLYREAIERLARTRARTALARAHLLYGEWLRRERRRIDAREHLRTAYELFATMGAAAFADRAARELLATGETARRRTPETRDQLTAQEAQIARLARDGLSNPEIGARLFLSPRTIEWHLRKVFAKLGISRRTELKNALTGDGDTPPATPS